MVKLFIFLIMIFTYTNASAKLTYKDSINLVHSIQSYGIEYGEGKQNVYVFVDPLCPYSRKFISMISSKPKMLEKYKYTIYLYEIPRLHSTDTIASIYNAKEPINLLLEVMLKDKKTLIEPTKKTETTVNAITNVAQKLHIKKRPFIIVEK
ncbi:hypothetical protein [Sulfurimonas sp.]|uniref:hypothetical protein n=1 Tax=Sulfurimonas sp. TaxID=2022749 RepID=UPI0035695EC6